MKKYVYLALCFAFVSPVFAQPAGLDFSFGFGGKVVVPFPDQAWNVNDRLLLQPDGSLLYTYSIIDSETRTEMIRYKTTGTLDVTFGDNGIASIPSAPEIGLPMMVDMALLPDWKFVMGLQGFEPIETADFILGRIKADGSLDPSFGTNGYVRTDFPGRADYLHVLKVQPDGKILAAGRSVDPASNIATFAVARYLPDGLPDPAFGNGGQQRITLPPMYRYNTVVDLELQSDGKIVLVGTSVDTLNTSITLARLNVDGSPDENFGTGGVAVTILSAPSLEMMDAVIQTDGRIVLLADFTISRDYYVLARFMTDGSLDSSFATAGMWISDPYAGFRVTRLALLPDDKILSAGYGYGYNKGMVLACHTPDGSLLTSFGNNGYITTEIGDNIAEARALVVQPDYKVVLAGTAYKNGTRVAVMARFFSGPLTVNEVEGIAQTALLYPNPTQGELTLSYTLTAAQTLKLDLLDVTGKVEVSFPNLVKPAGKYEEQLRLPETLPAGTYYLLITSAKGHTALPLVKR